jgi:hypothetical protein
LREVLKNLRRMVRVVGVDDRRVASRQESLLRLVVKRVLEPACSACRSHLPMASACRPTSSLRHCRCLHGTEIIQTRPDHLLGQPGLPETF